MSPADWYRILLRVYPAEFRERYGDEMVAAFVRMLERAGDRGGLRARARIWVGATTDAVRRGLGARLRSAYGGLVGVDDHSKTIDGDEGTTVTMTRWIEGIVSDVRFGLRALLRRPVFSLTAVAALALGIGASTSIFTVINGILLKPLPYENPDRIVTLWAAHPERGWTGMDVNMADAWEWGQRSDALASLSIHDDRRVSLTGGDRPEFATAIYATANVFDVVGVEPARGRGFVPQDNEPGAGGVAVLSHDFWQARFGGDPEILGRSLTLDGDPHTVVGVLPEDFYYTDEFADLFVPWRKDPATAARDAHNVEAVARLAPGASVEQLRRELDRITREQARLRPETSEGWKAEVVPLRTDISGELNIQAGLVLLVAGVFVLIMACVNVANLLLARAMGRRREMAVRAAMGAGRARVVRQLLIESGILALAGGAVGTILSVWGSGAIVSRLPDVLPPAWRFGMDWRVLAFTVTVSVAAVFGVGLLPALRSSRTDADALRDGGRTGTSRRGRRFGSALVVVQTAVAMVLLVAGGTLFRSVSNMHETELGFEARGVLTMGLIPPESRYEDDRALKGLYERITERVRGIPGLRTAGWIQSPPLHGSNWNVSVRIPGREVAGEDEGLPARVNHVSPGYLEAMEIEVVAGRPIRDRDRSGSEPVVLVNRLFVERYLGGGDPLTTTVEGVDEEPRRIVGVVENTVERGVHRPSEPTVFVPQAQNPTRARFLVARTGGDPMGLVDQIRREVWAVDGDLPFLAPRTMEGVLEQRLAGFELIAGLMGAFALLALILGGVGIYGVTAYGVRHRRQEIGVRLALGAVASEVRRRVVRDGLIRAGVGLGIGLILAVLLTRALTALLVGVRPSDPVTFAAVTAVLAGVASLAAYLPARRASSIDPVRTLNQE